MIHFKPLLAAALVLVVTLSSCADDASVSESPLTPEEAKLLQRIAKVDPSFRYGDKVKRYFSRDPETKHMVPILIGLVSPRTDGLYYGEYISYDVTMSPYNDFVLYSYDGGTANRGEGIFLVTPRSVIRVERGCGVTACITRAFQNNKQLLNETIESGR